MLILQNLTYIHPNKDLLFEHIYLTINNGEKIALIGNNGSGKSTLLKIIANELDASSGQINLDSKAYYVPQIFGQYSELTIAQALGIEQRLHALKEILKGNTTEDHFMALDDDWTIEERCSEAFNYWRLSDLDLRQKMGTLSGGQKTKVLLAGISIHQSEFVLLDEPSNHLDADARTLLYDFLRNTSCTLLVVSHDRLLLNLFDKTAELSKDSITIYGGHYGFYAMQKQIGLNALEQDVKSKEKALRKAREKQHETLERQQKLDARGKKKQEKAGIATIMMKTLRNSAEKSTAKIKGVHGDKIDDISQKLQALRKELPDIDKIKFGFDDTALHKGKILFKATGINFSYNKQLLWPENQQIQIISGERVALTGMNGSGKTTLIKIILNILEPQIGTVYRAENNWIYIDQDYSLIDNHLSVYEQAQRYNGSAFHDHEIKIRLTRFLFTTEFWDKSCAALSGGERMRLMLCCLTIGNQSPDLIILDEPTNNLDIQNIEILTAAIKKYRGTLIVVSHDAFFLEQINITSIVELKAR